MTTSRRDFLKYSIGAAVLAAVVSSITFSDMPYRLGKNPARTGAVTFRLQDYTNSNLPTPPTSFGHENLVKSWGMLGNDFAGDCVWAGAAHEHMLWTAEGGTPAAFTDDNVLSTYSAVTGYDPTKTDSNGNNITDQGTDVADALKYRRTTGIKDSSGNTHKLGAYVGINPNDLALIRTSMWLFSATAVGFQLPSTAIGQLQDGKPWDVVPGAYIEGGHYVPLVGFRNGYFMCVTWGQTQLITPRFMAAYCDEAYALFSPEYLASGKSPEGFNANQLIADLESITK